MNIVFAGTIGRSGLGGQAWANLQYLLGLRALGHEVFYLEDCGDSSWVYHWEKEEWTTDPVYPANYVRACLEPFAFAGRWIYRTTESAAGTAVSDLVEFCAAADLLIMRAVPLWVWRPEYDGPRRRAFIDVDPGFTQVRMANGDEGLEKSITRCQRRFTVGQRIGAPDCSVPTWAGPWLKTLPPVMLSEWPFSKVSATHFTSVIRWQGVRETNWNGATYGQRDLEFRKYLDLPRQLSMPFRLALMGTEPETLTAHGWEVAPGEIISRTPDSYRDFIQSSLAEFSVPKHGYVEAQSGWVSDRSVCYLASGRPVLIEQTGLGQLLPLGEGLVTFRDPAEARVGAERIHRDYEAHRRAARTLAEQHFAIDRVLPNFLDAATN